MWRTIAWVHEEIKRRDPGTAITKHFIRTLAQQGEIEAMNVKTKVLINFKSLCEFLKMDEKLEK